VKRSVNRRLFLRGAAGAALAVPFLGSLGRSARAQETTAPRRVVIFYTNNGCLTERWFPKLEGPEGAITAAALEGTTLAGLSAYAPKLLFPRGLGMAPKGFNVSVDGVQYFDPHDQGMGSKLTCAPLDPAGDHYALSHSLDHEIAKLVNPAGTSQSPLVLSVGFAGTGVKQVLSYSASRTPYAPETNPKTVYTTLTGLFTGGQPTEADYRATQGKSIIDLVGDDLQTFKRLKMSGGDQKKIDDWLALLRETEKAIPVACNAEMAAELGITTDTIKAAGGGGFGASNGTAMTLGGDLMLNLIALTMICDNNRSIVMQWPSFVTFNFEPFNHTIDHHGLSHRVGSAATSGTCVSGVLDRINEIDNWYAGRFAKLVGLLDGIKEGERSLLDNSAVMWLPELADGNAHNNNNLPIVIAGSAGGYLKQGASVNVSSDAKLAMGSSEAACQTEGEMVTAGSGTGSQGGNTPLNKLYVTLLNAVGAKTPEGAAIETFGVSDNGGSGGFGGGSITFTTDGAGKVTDGTIKDPGELSLLRANA
jgi:hypothetical protein